MRDYTLHPQPYRKQFLELGEALDEINNRLFSNELGKNMSVVRQTERIVWSQAISLFFAAFNSVGMGVKSTLSDLDVPFSDKLVMEIGVEAHKQELERMETELEDRRKHERLKNAIEEAERRGEGAERGTG